MRLPTVDLLNVTLHHGEEHLVVGRLAPKGHRILFEYDPTFVQKGLELSPFQLPLGPGVREESKRIFDGLFGLFHDSLPDGWGQLLLDREMERQGINRADLTPLHRLACVGRRGMGALAYEPEIVPGLSRAREEIDLDAIASSATRVLEGAADDVFAALLDLGGSSGGARPKVLVGWRPKDDHLVHGTADIPSDHLPYIVKFRAQNVDPEDVGRIEWAYGEMARAAGLEVSEARLFVGKGGMAYFGTRRFDRTANQGRVHIHSLGGLLHASHRIAGSLDYYDLMRATRRLTKDQREAARAYRQMVFNVLAHNRDDHVKNFAFSMDLEGHFRLTPAFDLTFSNGPGGEHWLAIAGEGRNPGHDHLAAVAKTAGLSEKEAREYVDDVRGAIAHWRRLASAAGVSRVSRERIAKAIGLEPESRRGSESPKTPSLRTKKNQRRSVHSRPGPKR